MVVWKSEFSLPEKNKGRATINHPDHLHFNLTLFDKTRNKLRCPHFSKIIFWLFTKSPACSL